MSSTENNEVAVEKVDVAEEKTETKEVKGAKRPAEVRNFSYLWIFCQKLWEKYSRPRDLLIFLIRVPVCDIIICTKVCGFFFVEQFESGSCRPVAFLLQETQSEREFRIDRVKFILEAHHGVSDNFMPHVKRASLAGDMQRPFEMLGKLKLHFVEEHLDDLFQDGVVARSLKSCVCAHEKFFLALNLAQISYRLIHGKAHTHAKFMWKL